MEWIDPPAVPPLVAVGVCALLVVVALMGRGVVRRTRLGRRLDAAVALLVAGMVVAAVDVGARAAGWAVVTPYLNALVLGALALACVHAALTLFVDFYLHERSGAVFSAIFRDVVGLVAYFLVIVIVLRTTLDINLASLVATSAVLTAIIGLALQDMLSNLFSGLALELETPFAPGDWVRVGTFEGTVEETGWRTTKIRTRVNELVTLPNALLAKEPLVNYSRPDPLHGDTLRFEAGYEAPPNEVKRAVAAVLAGEPAVSDRREIELRVERFAESGVGYAIRYWITDYGELDRIRNRLMTNLWYALRRAAVRIPYPARDVFVHAVGAPPPADGSAAATLRSVALLAPLDDAEIGQLSRRVRCLTYGAGEVVVRERETGDSFYVIEQGSADVSIGVGGASRPLRRLGAGDVFGEMSLLAGEPRAATVQAASDLVVLVVDREAFREIIAANPAILDPLSDIAARRQAERLEQLRAAAERRTGAPDTTQAQRLRERIKAFFGL